MTFNDQSDINTSPVCDSQLPGQQVEIHLATILIVDYFLQSFFKSNGLK